MKKKIRSLSPTSYFFTLAITCYDEQLKDGEERLYSSILSTSTEEYQLLAIKHNRGIGKIHYHILVRLADSKKRKQVKSLLNMLHISFRPGLDDALLTHNDRAALETCGDFSAYAAYLLHQTDEAIADNKVPYDKSEFITNLSHADLDAILSGYFQQKKPLNQKRMSSLSLKIKDAGYNLSPFNQQISSFNILGLSLSQEERLRKAYCQGVSERLKTRPFFYRLTIEIEYPQSSTITLEQRINQAIFSAMRQYNPTLVYGDSVCFIDPSVHALFWQNFPNTHAHPYYEDELNQLSANKIIKIGKPLVERKTIWAGKYFVFTHNHMARTKEEYRQITGGSNPFDPALLHKFAKNSFFCSVDNNKLKCLEVPSISYSEEAQKYIKNMFLDFKNSFEEAYAKIPKTKYSKIDIGDLNN